MKINYFDFGLHKGDEISMFLDAVEPLGADILVYGFEPHPELFKAVSKRYSKDDRVKIYPYAISNKNSKSPLYIAEKNKMEGNSLFDSKSNVDPENYVEVETIVFSDFVKGWGIESDINVVRFNIEGAEIYLFEDIIHSELKSKIKLYLGAKDGVDILKCKEIAHMHKKYMSDLVDNGINVNQFCAATINDNITYKEIQDILKNFSDEK